MKTVLFDTNVYVSALVFGGTPSTALQLAETLGVEIAVSASIKSELVDVLVQKFGWSRQRVEEACQRLWKNARWVAPRDTPTGSGRER